MTEKAALTGRHEYLTPQDLGLEHPHDANTCDPATWLQTLPSLPPEGMDLPQTLEQIERHFVLQALQHSKNNESQAARLLTLNHHTFRYRHKKLVS
jgi:DNA-binding NtrC family response regulator